MKLNVKEGEKVVRYHNAIEQSVSAFAFNCKLSSWHKVSSNGRWFWWWLYWLFILRSLEHSTWTNKWSKQRIWNLEFGRIIQLTKRRENEKHQRTWLNVNLGLYLILKLMNKAADIRIFNQNMYDAYLLDFMDRVSNVDRVLNTKYLSIFLHNMWTVW